MIFRARIANSQGRHEVHLQTGDRRHSIDIPPRSNGYGSDANGGELLFLALATCYGNDIYREATKRGIPVEQVEVEVEGEFGAEGEPARNVTYKARVTAKASVDAIRDLMQYTDTVAEIQNTLRLGMSVRLTETLPVSIE